MCGICGIFDGAGSGGCRDAIFGMAEILRHRGPDDEGYLAVKTAEGAAMPLGGRDSRVSLPPVVEFKGGADLYFAHRRLSIIDLSPAGHQPMSYDEGNLWVTYNGELYNHQDLRSELSGLGHCFRTRTDTEVLLAAYREWGEECLDRFDGMWSFVLYDRRRNVLFGSRDRFGVKPLYYVENGQTFAFASEAKAFSALRGFQRSVRPEAVLDYLAFGIDRWDDGRTFLEDVMELPSSHAFRFDLDTRRLEIYRYYQLPFSGAEEWEPFCSGKASSYVERVRELLFSSVRRRLSSDVPVGTCLSGGVDSSSLLGVIAAILQKESIAEVGESPKAFTARCDDASIDEGEWARMVAERSGAEWYSVYPSSEELVEDLEDLVYVQDFPFYSTSIYAQYRVMRLAKEQGVTVLLDGQGGDELFTGYTPYYVAFFRDMLGHGAWSDLSREWRAFGNAPMPQRDLLKKVVMAKLVSFLPHRLKKYGYTRRMPLMRYIDPDLLRKHLSSCLDRLVGRVASNDSVNGMLFSLMSSSSLQALLRYEDRNSMRFQIESRTPFADDRSLIEQVFAIPGSCKIHDGFSKWLLRESVRDLLPERVYRRRDKIGFATPGSLWLQSKSGYFRDIAAGTLGEFVNVDEVCRDWDSLIGTSGSAAGHFWRLLNLGVWLKINPQTGVE